MDAKYFKFSVIEAAPPVNLVYNGTFDSTAGWTEAEANIVIADGVCHITGFLFNGDLKQTAANMVAPLQPSTNYTMTFDVSNTTGMYFRLVDDEVSYELIAYDTYTNGTGHSVGFTTPESMTGWGICFIFQSDAGDLDNIVITAD